MATTGGGGIRPPKKTVTKTAISPNRYVRPRAITGGTVIGGAGAVTRLGSVARAAGMTISQMGPGALANPMRSAKRELARGGLVTPRGPKVKRPKKKKP